MYSESPRDTSRQSALPAPYPGGGGGRAPAPADLQAHEVPPWHPGGAGGSGHHTTHPHPSAGHPYCVSVYVGCLSSCSKAFP